MTNLERALEDLKRAKLDYAGTPPHNELPRRPFGLFTEPTFEHKVGRRSSEFTAAERAARESVVLRRDAAVSDLNNATPAASNGNQRDSRISVEGSGLGGKSSFILYMKLKKLLPRGKGKYRSTDNTKIRMNWGNSYRKKEEVSGRKAQIHTWNITDTF